jgi:hypothetical protein
MGGSRIERPARKINDGHHRGAVDRRSASDEISVSNETRDGRHHREAAEEAGDPKDHEREPRQNGDVAA